ncbi:periplasmic component of amino acid ABC-type transporter/signal transduction system [Shewanella psychrophila]|uniref:Periplasmic component of amino acid ABC-type transporter/signal transduction system n=1 Tax=Shewanella psychrophila TaxID=225848 RepID=A0A1S6HXP6_9GAMM|nr:ABC transporter substrate-binding protein [Shewanella psychrophila]AQS40330.1 periplasmic component of amino acid ABC-type transporter/signal transduction system [Shewanella psychrophila]
MSIEKITHIEPLDSYFFNFLAWIRCFLPSIVLVLSVSMAPAKANTIVLSLTTGDDYPPFTGRELPQGGMASTLVINAFEKSGYVVKEIEWLPWKRGYTLAQRGQYHATFPYGWTAEREESFYFSDPFFPTLNYAWSRSGQSNTLTNEEDLQGTVYCNPRGYGNFGQIKELMDRNLLRRETPNSMLHCFRMLLQKRVDFVAATPNDAMKALLQAEISPEEVQRSGFVITEIPLHVIVSKQRPRALEIIDAFNKGLKILRENGRYEALKEEFNWVE